jgi:hypothetical protein
MASALSRAGAANKHVAGFDPLTHFRGLRLHHEGEESGNGIREAVPTCAGYWRSMLER